MCGLIAFFHDGEQTPPAARRALESLRHRGPDEGGEWVEDGVFLGHRRLSIIDLRTGQQPMRSADGRYVIVFNGEIYNYRELRQELISAGAAFRTQSDTEVILEGYRYWGPAVVAKLNGMFAFVMWDRLSGQAFGARDRLGIKPLCWAVKDGVLIVASTLEPFATLGSFDELDPVAVRDLMTFDYIPAPRTIRKGVWKLEPGTRFEWRRGAAAPTIERYWTPPVANGTIQPPAQEELEELLDRSVKRQMVSDVPLGVLLSGGLDSSLLVALMARHSDKPIKTFTVAFGDSEFDESSIAKRVANEFGTDHAVVVAEELGADALHQLLGSLDEPFCDPALVPLYSLCRLTSRHVKVAMCGDGADEVFGGYEKYLRTAPASRESLLGALLQDSVRALPWRPRGMGHLYRHTLTPQQRVRYAYTRYGDFPVFRKDLRQLFSPDFGPHACIDQFFEPWERHRRLYGDSLDTDVLMRTDIHTYLSENCLVKTDRASMLASLEVRVPFLDELLLDRILPLPGGSRIPEQQLKALLQPLARRLLPREVWDRPKHGFNVPIDARLSGSWSALVDDALDWGERHLPVFNYPYLRRLQRIGRTQAGIGSELWNPVVLVTWAMSQSTHLTV
jgi:asparagine synthase (glutamine-hydrolysing)